MRLVYYLVTYTIDLLSRILCRVDESQLSRVPKQGPLILVVNHVNFLDVPLLYTRLLPRRVTALVKVELYHSPLTALVATTWQGIPIHRGEADVDALRKGLDVLKKGHILAVAPEGTRSGHGRLQRGLPGTVLLALHSGAPLLPLVYYGHEGFWDNLKHLRRTDFHIVVGEPFLIDSKGARVTRQMRQEIVDEIMYQLAALLPPPYRGVYADLSQASEKYLTFLPGAKSNLERASGEA